MKRDLRKSERLENLKEYTKELTKLVVEDMEEEKVTIHVQEDGEYVGSFVEEKKNGKVNT